MLLSDNDINKVKENGSRFISLKYIDLLGNLLQIDTSSHNIESNSIENLKPILNKSFLDPFRSTPTTTFFCENLNDFSTVRSIILKNNDKLNFHSSSMEISFWPKDFDDTDDLNDGYSYLNATTPLDKYSNLRSDIVEILENIGIKCTVHYHGMYLQECIIGIVGDSVVDLADNFIISKFIIENVAESYSKKVLFSSDTYNLNIDLVIKKEAQERFIHKLTANKQNICNLFNYKNVNNNLLLCQKYNSNVKVSINTKNIFNPYLVLASIVLNNSANNCDISDIFSQNILNNYMDLINLA